jgi:hypothetical protein
MFARKGKVPEKKLPNLIRARALIQNATPLREGYYALQSSPFLHRLSLSHGTRMLITLIKAAQHQAHQQPPAHCQP